MAFSVSFYNISDPPNKLNKTIPETAAHVAQSASPYEPMSELTGKIILAHVTQADGCNYCSITEGSVTQYYFITDTVLLPGGKFEVYLKRDVLMTYSSDIKNMRIVAKRSSCIAKDGGNVGYNSYLEDGMWQIDSTALYWLSTDLFNGYFNYDYEDNGYILMTAG